MFRGHQIITLHPKTDMFIKLHVRYLNCFIYISLDPYKVNDWYDSITQQLTKVIDKIWERSHYKVSLGKRA